MCGVLNLARVVEDLKRSGKEAEMSPGFKRVMYNEIPKTVYSSQIFCYKPS